jgi:hypothetical protein
MRRSRLILLAVLVGIAAVVACGTSAIGVDDCTTIEDALCKRVAEVPSCMEPNELPHPGDSVSACTRFYSIACLHGLATTTAPLKEQVTACVDAINETKNCAVLEAPQFAPDAACAWLIPPDGGVDGGDAAAAADATADADSGEGG